MKMKWCFSMLMGVFSLSTQAEGLCQGHFVNPLTDICWRCIFPLSIGSTPIATGGMDLPDTMNPTSPIQVCPTEGLPRPGLAIGYWEPGALVDITAKPYCMVNLGGVQFDLGMDVSQGGRNETDGDRYHSFYHAHWYHYPILEWLGVLDDAVCMQKGDFDLAYLSELDPTWDDDELSFIINPEAILFSSVLLQASCVTDSLASSVNASIDALFWCMGSQGSTYPLTGHVGFENSALSASTLLSERLNFKLHRLGMLWDTEGIDGVVCAEYPHPIMPKSRYRYQMVNTIPDVLSCHPFGRTTMHWEWMKQTPEAPKEFGTLIWKKRNCVAF